MLSALFPSVCPYGTERLSLEGFSWNSYLEFFTEIYQHFLIVVKMGQIKRRTTDTCVNDRYGGERLCFVCQVRTDTQEAVVNGNTQSSILDCILLGSDVPTFTRNGL